MDEDEHVRVARNFGRRIVDLRALTGLSQVGLAKRVSLSQPAIVSIEKGRTSLNVLKFGVFARAFGVTVGELVAGLGYDYEKVEIKGSRATASAPPRITATPGRARSRVSVS